MVGAAPVCDVVVPEDQDIHLGTQVTGNGICRARDEAPSSLDIIFASTSPLLS